MRFRGTDRTAFLDNRQFHGNPFALLRAAKRFLRDSLPIAERIKEGRVERIDEDCRLAWLAGCILFEWRNSETFLTC